VGGWEQIRQGADGAPPWHVRHVDETGSTNADLLAAARAGAPDRAVLVAAYQTAGRGRLDRRWEAPSGANLLVSLLFREMPDDPGRLMRRTGVAVVDACRVVAGVDAVLKWPNDVLLADRKLAGILAERGVDGCVVVGVGLNVAWAPDGGTCLGGRVSPGEVLDALLDAYDGIVDVEPAYRERLATLGRRVHVELPVGSIDGTAVDVGADGRLVVVDTDGFTHRLDVGDVVHLRPGVPPG
jgi:BirA family transcriptional regulator, biotin operon repressor / biotin---[acetyl-CoA-carboxylase] ligase